MFIRVLTNLKTNKNLLELPSDYQLSTNNPLHNRH